MVTTACVAVRAESRTSAKPTLCRYETTDGGRAETVIDGRTFVLADGREIRLAGLEVPIVDATEPRTNTQAEAAKAALEAFLRGRDIVIKGPSAPDRYGRLVAYVFAAADGQEQSAALAMLAGGHGWVSPRIEAACAAEFFASERSARAAKLGLWSDPYYEIKSAENPTDLLARQSLFTLVEGKVISVRESRGTTYVNFGRRWTEDFTAFLSKQNEKLFVGAGLDPKKLENRRIRVRGWIEVRSGPWIELTRPEQIEIIEGN
jgi:endonuclease YncB( thermonuclease family)